MTRTQRGHHDHGRGAPGDARTRVPLAVGAGSAPDPASLDRLWAWCLSAEGASRARAAAEGNWQPSLTRGLLAALTQQG
jgi:hypothetical protein